MYFPCATGVPQLRYSLTGRGGGGGGGGGGVVVVIQTFLLQRTSDEKYIRCWNT